ncbi:MAG: rhomboid family intramembrane serine protease [Rhodobiaceae bacterium]|nr:rhomboid family intramembrane serine protease [Rhodobiaceae bacterium]
MFPIADDNPTHSSPIVTWFLIATCIAIFVWQSSLPDSAVETVFITYGAIPANIFGPPTGAVLPFPPEMTLLSSQFLHGGLMHLGGNMLYLYIFGDNVEAAMGHLRFLAFYLVAGIAAALTHGALAQASGIPMIGASGAISGVLGAYLLLYPHARVRILFLPLPIPFFKIFAVPAIIVLGIWFAIQFVSAAYSSPEGGGVAFWAHVGGFIAGMVLLPLFKQRGVPYWQSPSAEVIDTRRKPGRWTRIGAGENRSDEVSSDAPIRRKRGPWDRTSDD